MTSSRMGSGGVAGGASQAGSMERGIASGSLKAAEPSKYWRAPRGRPACTNPSAEVIAARPAFAERYSERTRPMSPRQCSLSERTSTSSAVAATLPREPASRNDMPSSLRTATTISALLVAMRRAAPTAHGSRTTLCSAPLEMACSCIPLSRSAGWTRVPSLRERRHSRPTAAPAARETAASSSVRYRGPYSRPTERRSE
mmetsp:Transcript_25300/g.72863  ORF Transcript_25300/g.72863 Transcript_25300/m.72863 type:complete len:200 (+) Transcript_25300:3111-3710(+)